MNNITFIFRALLLFFIVVFACSKKNSETRKSEKKEALSQDVIKYISWSKQIELNLPDTLGIVGIPQIRADGESLLYIKLNPAWLIGVFDATGKLIKTIGSNGFGPGELRRIEFFQVDSMTNIYIIDGVTNELYKYNLNSGWITTNKPPKSSTMAFAKYGNNFIFFRRAYGGDESYHIQIYEKSNDSLRVIKELLKSSEESIRTRKLNSDAISINNKGIIVFSFFAPKVIYGITPQLELFEINMDPSEFKASETHVLLKKVQEQDGRGFIPEIFKNSRVLSLGFVNEDIFLLSFATGRYEQTKFYTQFYSLTTRKPVTKAIEIEQPLVSIGNHMFASWTFSEQDSMTNKETYLINLFKFEVIGNGQKD
jgi:hypothetical protein